MELLLYSTSLLLLLFSSQGLYSTEGKGLHYQLNELPKVQNEAGMVISEAMIGSRPPRCEGKCVLCGRCEAVQVPVAPQDKGEAGKLFSTISGRVDESSTNYKPLNWKCKCADRIMNP